MQHRQDGASQEVAAAKAGISVRSGRRIEKSGSPRHKTDRDWRTREDCKRSNNHTVPNYRVHVPGQQRFDVLFRFGLRQVLK